MVLQHDQILHDIPLEEEEAAEPHRMPRQDVRFHSWTNQECMDNTSFKKNQLRTIYDHFGLAQLAAQNGGSIRIPYTHWLVSRLSFPSRRVIPIFYDEM